jgi:predicted Fe-S protein YdhL (DUF1289 family)
MMDAEEPPQVTSPCVQVCILDEGCGYCIGCGRTRAEIWRWTRASDGEKLEIIEAAAARIGGPQRPK